MTDWDKMIKRIDDEVFIINQGTVEEYEGDEVVPLSVIQEELNQLNYEIDLIHTMVSNLYCQSIQECD